MMNAMKNILVPLDGSALAERSLPIAITLARKFDSQIILFRAVDIHHPGAVVPYLSNTTATALTTAQKNADREAKRYLHACRSELQGQGLKVEIAIEDAAPAEGIIDAAATYAVDMVIISTHGRSGLARWALGSVADKVVRHCPCPVLLVRQNGRSEQTEE